MSRDVEVENLAATVLDHKKAVQQPKCHRRHSEEVKSEDGFSMIRQERTPAPARIPVAGLFLQLAANAAFRHFEPELQKFAVDARRSPVWILICHSADQIPKLLIHLRATTATP
jgi:hypothetical protein